MYRTVCQFIQESKIWGEKNYSPALFLFMLLALFSLSFLGYHTYIGNHYYTFDDYNTLFEGFGDSVWNQYRATTSWLADWGGRFQPVRLFMFGVMGHLVPEDATIWYALSFHCFLLVLFGLLLKSFRIPLFLIFVILLYFTLFGRWRLMDSLASTLTGGELILAFFLASLLSLWQAVEANTLTLRRVFLFLSWFFYALLTFSYEMAFPFIAPLLFYYFFLLIRKEERLSLSHLYPIIPFFLLLLLYLFCAGMLYKKMAYTGTSIAINADIAPRIVTYLYNSFTFKITPKEMMPRWEWLPLLAIYFGLLSAMTQNRMQKKLWEDCQPRAMANPLWSLFCFGIVYYLSSISLFVINSWGTPYQYMAHHAFEHTVGSSIVSITALILLAYRVRAEKRGLYLKLLYIVLFPLLLLAGLNFHLRYGEAQSIRTKQIDLLKTAVMQEVKDISATDVVILKNYYPPYDGISALSGALTKWFGMKKRVFAGRDINKAEAVTITYTGNLTYYGDFSPERVMPKVENSRIAILYREPQQGHFLSYTNSIDYEKKEHIFQSLHVFDKEKPEGYEAILKKEDDETRFVIRLHDEASFQLKINGEELSMQKEKNNIYSTSLPHFKKPVRYFFIEISSPDEKFSQKISSLELTKE